MADAITAALLKEAGPAVGRRAGDISQKNAQAALTDLESPDLGKDDSPAQKAEREAQIVRLAAVARPGTTGPGGGGTGGIPAQPAPQAAPVAAPQQAANDPITAALLSEAGSVSAKGVPGSEGAQAADRNAGKPNEEGLLTRAKGVGEAGLALVTGAIAGPVAAAGGLLKGLTGGKYGTAEGGREAAARANEIAASLTYQPRTETGQDVLSTLGEIGGATKLAGLGPAEAITLGGLAAGPRAVQGARAVTRAESAGDGRLGSVGAAGVAPTEQARALAATATSPEVRQAIEKAAPKITPTGLQAAERHVQADNLPVPIKLTAGQATQDVTLLSQEQNARGGKPQIATRLNEQNAQLGENANAIRERAAPDVFSTSKPETAGIVIKAYEKLNAEKLADASAKWKALEEAGGGQFPLDGKAFAAAAQKSLRDKLATSHLPKSFMSDLKAFANGTPMTFEKFEAMRTDLAALARSGAQGAEKRAGGIVRDALENMPLVEGAQGLKRLADSARAATREYHALVNSDPAMKAIVKGKTSASADRFIDRYVVGASTKDVERMTQNVGFDPVAKQAISAGVIDKLKESARIFNDQGNFSPQGYNKALESMRPKLPALFSPQDARAIEDLGAVARYVKGQPTGSFVNNSNSAVTLLGEAAKSGAAGAANVAAHGIPIGTWARKGLGYMAEQRDLNRALAPGAGITLKEIAGGKR